MANSALLTLPDLGEGLTEARVLSLLTPAGGKTEVDAPVVVVETDKSVVELPAPLTGYVAEWFVRESDVIRVGEPLARFDVEPAGMPSLRMPATLQPPAAAPPAQAATA
ncbi:MAG: hypothetical protein QOI11_847, partial [Candidatus Eremiobacteraeota bacterium]|nr:hypothetical protein [Candidatus Eremiobacteraeota bacterium]